MTTPAASTVDASALISRAIAPYRGAIDGILREVTGDPTSVQRAGETYRAGADSSTRVASNVAAVSFRLSQSWQGPAGSAYAGASQDLTGRLDQVQGTLSRQAEAMAQVVQAQIQARSAVEQARGGLEGAERSLVAVSQNVSPAAVPQLVQQAHAFGGQFRVVAEAQREGLAGVLRQAAADLNRTAQRPAAPAKKQARPAKKAAAPAPAGYNAHHWNGGGRPLSDRMKAALDRLGDEYNSRVSKLKPPPKNDGITVTSGTRSAASQAHEMYTKLTKPKDPKNPLALYTKRNPKAAKEIQDAYDDAVAAKKTPAQAEAAIEAVIKDQMGRKPPVYISKHLIEGAVDLREKDMTAAQKQAFDEAVKATGDFEYPPLHEKGEGGGDHWHIQLKNQPQSAGAPAAQPPHPAVPPPHPAAPAPQPGPPRQRP